MKKIILIAFISLAGCATKYQQMGFTGGVARQQITSDTYRISARGNGYTPTTTVQDHMLLKAAETTRSAGATHFLVVSSADTSRSDIVTSPGYAQTNIVGTVAYTTYSPGSVHQIMKPGQDAYIRVINVAEGAALPEGAISADEIIKFIGARVERE